MLKLVSSAPVPFPIPSFAAAKETDQYELRAVYSRTLEKAHSFTQPYEQVALYDDLIAFF